MTKRHLALGLVLLTSLVAPPLGCSSNQKSGAGGGGGSAAAKSDQRTFATAQEAVDALLDAARRRDREAMRAMFGPEVGRLQSGDHLRDDADLQRFVAAYDLNHFLYDNGDGSFTLVMGRQEWEFPAPIVPAGNRWQFDTEAGVDEIITRTIGMNELHVVDVCAAYLKAQDQFFAMDPDGDGEKSYAKTFRSTPGKRDGLYWPEGDGVPMSPLGPHVAQAVASGAIDANTTTPQDYRGYFYRILTQQGAGAPAGAGNVGGGGGGARNYIDSAGRMTGGFALIAWPAVYDETGIMTFIVAQDGFVFQRDFGDNTAAEVANIKDYDPTGWTPVTE